MSLEELEQMNNCGLGQGGDAEPSSDFLMISKMSEMRL